MVANSIGKRSGGPWYSSYKSRMVFERNAMDEYPSLRIKNHRRGHKLWRQYNINIFLENYDVTRSATIKMLSTATSGTPPEVTVDGPTDSPHRYDKGQLF